MSFAGLTVGARSYLSISGGFNVPYVMGSKSTYLRGKIGGYTRLANIISVDIPLLGQMKPGDILNFKEISLDDAQNILRIENLQIQNLVK